MLTVQLHTLSWRWIRPSIFNFETISIKEKNPFRFTFRCKSDRSFDYSSLFIPLKAIRIVDKHNANNELNTKRIDVNCRGQDNEKLIFFSSFFEMRNARTHHWIAAAAASAAQQLNNVMPQHAMSGARLLCESLDARVSVLRAQSKP